MALGEGLRVSTQLADVLEVQAGPDAAGPGCAGGHVAHVRASRPLRPQKPGGASATLRPGAGKQASRSGFVALKWKPRAVSCWYVVTTSQFRSRSHVSIGDCERAI